MACSVSLVKGQQPLLFLQLLRRLAVGGGVPGDGEGSGNLGCENLGTTAMWWGSPKGWKKKSKQSGYQTFEVFQGRCLGYLNRTGFGDSTVGITKLLYTMMDKHRPRYTKYFWENLKRTTYNGI